MSPKKRYGYIRITWIHVLWHNYVLCGWFFLISAEKKRINEGWRQVRRASTNPAYRSRYLHIKSSKVLETFAALLRGSRRLRATHTQHEHCTSLGSKQEQDDSPKLTSGQENPHNPLSTLAWHKMRTADDRVISESTNHRSNYFSFPTFKFKPGRPQIRNVPAAASNEKNSRHSNWMRWWN